MFHHNDRNNYLSESSFNALPAEFGPYKLDKFEGLSCQPN